MSDEKTMRMSPSDPLQGEVKKTRERVTYREAWMDISSIQRLTGRAHRTTCPAVGDVDVRVFAWVNSTLFVDVSYTSNHDDGAELRDTVLACGTGYVPSGDDDHNVYLEVSVVFTPVADSEWALIARIVADDVAETTRRVSKKLTDMIKADPFRPSYTVDETIDELRWAGVSGDLAAKTKMFSFARTGGGIVATRRDKTPTLF